MPPLPTPHPPTRRLPIVLLAVLLPIALAGGRWAGTDARAATLTDATGRGVAVPDSIARVLPAGPPAAVLLAALAPDLMLGWPHPPSAAAAAWLPPALAALPAVPAADPAQPDPVRALHPDLILDYGTVDARYVRRIEQEQAATGIPAVLLDGALPRIPDVLRALGAVLHREQRAATLAALAARMLDGANPPPSRVLYARGADGLTVGAPGTGSTEVFATLGWTVLAPDGTGTFRHATLAQIAALDPDRIYFADPAIRATIAGSADWGRLRAVREGHAVVVPGAPFGWTDEPPSINRLLGLAWLRGADPMTAAVAFDTALFGQAPTDAQIAALRAALAPIAPPATP